MNPLTKELLQKIAAETDLKRKEGVDPVDATTQGMYKLLVILIDKVDQLQKQILDLRLSEDHD